MDKEKEHSRNRAL